MPENIFNTKNVAVIGTGSWGTALAVLIARNNFTVNFWGRNTKHLDQLSHDRCNSQYLPGIDFPPSLNVINTLEDCIKNVKDILLVVPSSGIRNTVNALKPFVNAKTHRIALASKGLEQDSLQLLHEVVIEVLGNDFNVCVISGPTFAKEVANKLPTAITVASNNNDFADQFSGYLSNEYFRAYTSSDIIGVEIGGATKNVMAIAAGIADGLGFNANTRAALITRALAEISRLGIQLGGKQETFMGMAGLGDLILTCTDNQSRNRRVGLGLAENKTIPQIQVELGQVAEGIATTEKIYLLAQKLNIEMPIVSEVYQVIYQHKKPADAVRDLLARHAGAEIA